MSTPSRPWTGLGLLASCLGLLTLARCQAAGYEQHQGPALVRLEAKQGKDGRIRVPLSGTTLTLIVTGKAPLQAAWEGDFTPAKSWKVRKVATAAPHPDPARCERRYYLEPLGKPEEALDLQLPPLRLSEDGQPERRVTWQPIRMRITTQIKEATLSAMRPGTGPEEVPPAWSWSQALCWVLLILVLTVLGLVGWELLRRRVRRPGGLTPHGWALREFDRLAALDLSAGGELERFPTLVSDVVRRYLELQFRLHAPRQTTAEFLEAMRQAPQLTAAQQAMLRDFLERCDLAKFARLTPSAAECRALAAKARTFIEQTVAPTPA